MSYKSKYSSNRNNYNDDNDEYDFGGGDDDEYNYSSNNNNNNYYNNNNNNNNTPSFTSEYKTNESVIRENEDHHQRNEQNLDDDSRKNTNVDSENKKQDEDVSNNSYSNMLNEDEGTEMMDDMQKTAPKKPKHKLGFVENEECGSVNIDSSWRSRVSTNDGNCQTDEIEQYDEEVQTSEKNTTATQTEEEEDPGLKEACSGFVGWEPKDSNLRDFIMSASQLVQDQLIKNNKSLAFEDFDNIAFDDGEIICSDVLTCKAMQNVPVFKFDNLDQKQDNEPDRIDQSVNAIDWNATGSILVAGYGQRVHSGWGSGAKAGCAVWNIFARDFKVSEPRLFLPTETCVMSVACHPELPAVIAAGTFNGEIVVWDTSIEDERPMMIASTRIDDYFHRESVVSLKWIYDDSEQDNYLLVSESGEGKVLFWSLSNKLVCPISGYLLQTKRKSKGRSSEKNIVGGTAMSFQSGGVVQIGEDERTGNPIMKRIKYSTSFVVGSEGGQLFRCFLRKGNNSLSVGPNWTPNASGLVSKCSSDNRKAIGRHIDSYLRDLGESSGTVTLETIYESRPPPELLFPNPIDLVYEPHVGPIHEIACSPFHRNVFLTCGADGNAGIYNVLQKKPLVVVDPSLSYLMSVAWSNVRPMVFCVGSEDGTTHIYDLSHSMSAPLFSLPANANKEDTIESNEKASSTKQPSLRNNENISTTCVRFNPRLGTLLATSDSAGQVKIWKLSPSLATPRNDEESQLELFFKQFTDESDESAPPGGRKKKKKKKTKPAPSSSTDGGDDSKK